MIKIMLAAAFIGAAPASASPQMGTIEKETAAAAAAENMETAHYGLASVFDAVFNRDAGESTVHPGERKAAVTGANAKTKPVSRRKPLKTICSMPEPQAKTVLTGNKKTTAPAAAKPAAPQPELSTTECLTGLGFIAGAAALFAVTVTAPAAVLAMAAVGAVIGVVTERDRLDSAKNKDYAGAAIGGALLGILALPLLGAGLGAKAGRKFEEE